MSGRKGGAPPTPEEMARGSVALFATSRSWEQAFAAGVRAERRRTRPRPHDAPTLPDTLGALLGALDAAIALADAADPPDVETALHLLEARHLVHAADARLRRRAAPKGSGR